MCTPEDGGIEQAAQPIWQEQRKLVTDLRRESLSRALSAEGNPEVNYHHEGRAGAGSGVEC